MNLTFVLMTWLAGNLSPCTPTSRPATVRPSAAEIEARATESARTPVPPCDPGLDLALGEWLVGRGRPGEALLPLARATVDGDESARSYLALAEALALDGKAFDALRAVSLAQGLIRPDDPRYEHALDIATLLARLYVRRGGTVLGAYRFDAPFEQLLKKELDKRSRIDVASGRVVILGKERLIDLKRNHGSVLPRHSADAADVDVLADGTVAVLNGLDVQIADAVIALSPESASGFRPQALAVTRQREIYVLSDGQVHAFDAQGRSRRPPLALAGAVDLAVDGRRYLHVLRGGDGGVVSIDPEGRIANELSASGSDHQWKRVRAIAADRFGGIYVLATFPAVVYVFAPDGSLAGRIDPPLTDRSLILNTTAIGVDDDGTIYLLNGKRKSVVRYR